jgi:Histidine phosphatase superfamily (branch 1)
MTGARRPSAAAAVLFGLLLCGCASGLSGGVFVRPSGGGIGAPIANVALSFVREDGSAAFAAVSDANGRYAISLDPGRYYMLAGHPDYEDDNSAPGFAVVDPNTHGTANFFLREPQVTTVLIVRHGEKQDPNSTDQNEPLSADGQARALALRETLLRSGLSAVYATDTRRTRDTVTPLAAVFRLSPQIYASANALANDVLAQHRGDVVLVAAHSETAAMVANAFGTQLPTTSIADFDNLYVVSIAGTVSNAVNLQYGADSTPDTTKNDPHAMTLLLIGSDAPAGAPELQQLLHSARKAGVTAIYTGTAVNALVAPLAMALGSRRSPSMAATYRGSSTS